MVGLGVENQDLPTGKILREILGLPTVSLSQLTRRQIFCFWLEFFQRSVVMCLMLIRSLAVMYVFEKEKMGIEIDY